MIPAKAPATTTTYPERRSKYLGADISSLAHCGGWNVLERNALVDACQSARKIDPLSASKIDPTCAVVAGPGRCNYSNEWNRPGSAGGRMLRHGS